MTFPIIPERLRAYFDQHTPGFWSWWQAAKWQLDRIQSYVDFGGNVTNGNAHDHIGGDGAPITEGAISLSDVTTDNVSISKHGFCPKAPNDTAKFLRGDATWAATPAAPIEVIPGLICGWTGYLTDCPTGWAVCDGTQGTPDLTGSFIT